jgi:HAD superfamily hydrolase (TIGR01662 family)
MSQEVVLLCGTMAGGKSSLSKKYIDEGYVYLNRDSIGGKLDSLIPMMVDHINKGDKVFLDNTFGTKKSRAPFISACKIPIRCIHLTTSTEDATFNAASRMIERYGKLLSLEEIKNSKDPNIFPVSALFSYNKNFEPPTRSEGFASIEEVRFVRKIDPSFTGKALLLDYDGTLRKTKSGQNYPLVSSDIEILPNRREVLQRYKDEGYLLLGVSNQSGVGKGRLSNGAVRSCFEETNRLVGHDIDYAYCPHGSFPIACYCRKPLTGLFVQFMLKYKLDPNKCIFVGDLTSDKTFAKRSGIKYYDQAEFFK